MRARTYIMVIQAPEGYAADSELRKLEETPAPPVVHAVVLLDDHEKLEAEVERLRTELEALRAIAGRFMARGHCGFEPDDVSEELAKTLQELSLIRRRAGAAAAWTGDGS